MKCLARSSSHVPGVCTRLGWLRGDRYNLSDMLKVPTLSGKKFTCHKLHIPIPHPHHHHHPPAPAPSSPPNPSHPNSLFTHRLNLYLSRKMFLSSSSLPSLSLILFSSSATRKATLNVSNWGRKEKKKAHVLRSPPSRPSNSPFLWKPSQTCLLTSPHRASPRLLAAFLPSSRAPLHQSPVIASLSSADSGASKHTHTPARLSHL